jgi:hypothetical protein
VMVLLIDCPNPKEDGKLEFRGARLVTIKPGCSGHAPGYSISSYPTFTYNATLESSKTTWRMGQLLHNITTDVLDVLMPEHPFHPVLLEDLKEKYWAIERAQTGWPWHLNFGLSFLSTAMVLGLCVGVVICFRHRLAGCISALLGETKDRSGVVYHVGGGRRASFGEEAEEEGFVVPRLRRTDGWRGSMDSVRQLKNNLVKQAQAAAQAAFALLTPRSRRRAEQGNSKEVGQEMADWRHYPNPNINESTPADPASTAPPASAEPSGVRFNFVNN